MREVIFYRSDGGACPVQEFLDDLSDKAVQKVLWVLRAIRDLDRIPSQYFKKLIGSDGIWELRIDFGSDTFRILGFIEGNRSIVLTNGFRKKSQRVPPFEIRLAERRKKDFAERRNTHG